MQSEPDKWVIVPHPLSAIVKGALRSVAASFPAWAWLGQAWNEYEGNRTSRRIQELFGNVKAELARISQTSSENSDAIKTCQGFPELLEIAIDKVRKEFSGPKRAAYARILVRLLAAGGGREHDEGVTLLDSLDSLSEKDLRVLLLFRGEAEAEVGDLPLNELGLEGDLSVQLLELTSHLAKLESRGLVLRVAQAGVVAYVRRGLMPAAARVQENRYRLLPLGERLCDMLS